MKLNNKNIIEYVKNTKFDCFQINGNGTRGTHYSGCNPLQALSYISINAQAGKKVVLTAYDTKYSSIYPELEALTAISFSQRDTDFVNRIQKLAIKTEDFNRY